MHHFAAFVGFTTSTTMPRFWGQTIIHGPMPNRSPTWELFFGKGALGGGRKRRRGPAAATTCSITLTHCLCCCNALSCAGPWDLRRTWTSHPSSWVPFPLQAHNSSPKEMPKTTDVPRWVQDHPPNLCIPEHTLVVHASFPPPSIAHADTHANVASTTPIGHRRRQHLIPMRSPSTGRNQVWRQAFLRDTALVRNAPSWATPPAVVTITCHH